MLSLHVLEHIAGGFERYRLQTKPGPRNVGESLARAASVRGLLSAHLTQSKPTQPTESPRKRAFLFGGP